MVIWLALSLSCGTPDQPVAPPQPQPQTQALEALSAPRLLRRLSLDLRGVLPSVEELDAVRDDPSLISTYRDEYLQDDRLGERLVSFFAEHMRTRLDEFQVEADDYRMDADKECDFDRSVGEEPLRLMAYVATHDLPWTEIVTADYTVANDMLVSVWPLEWVEGEEASSEAWRRARYTDGRPSAGVLGTNGLWWRYVTSVANSNRSRAAALSSLLLCEDILSRPVSFADTPSLTDEEATKEALRSNEYCLGCHAHIEPLASALFGFYPSIDYSVYELAYYHPEREALGPEVLGVEPAYFGTPIAGLVELGPSVANDSRFLSCAAETMAKLLWRRPVEFGDFNRLESFRESFLRGGVELRPLIQAITDDEVYQAGKIADSAADGELEREHVVRMLSPDQMVTVLSDLTGFSWRYNECDQLGQDDSGYRILAGGVDGYNVTRPQTGAGLTWAMVVKRAAQGASVGVVDHDLDLPLEDGRSLLTLVTDKDIPGDEAFGAQLQELSWRLLAEELSAEDQASQETFWASVADETDGRTAWKALVSAILRDPDFVTY